MPPKRHYKASKRMRIKKARLAKFVEAITSTHPEKEHLSRMYVLFVTIIYSLVYYYLVFSC